MLHYHHCPDHSAGYKCERAICDDRPVMVCLKCERVYYPSVRQYRRVTSKPLIKDAVLEAVPMSMRATGRVIPDLTGREHVCEWQGKVRPQ